MKPEPEVPDAVTLKSIKDLVFEHGDNNFGTAFPFWYIAVKGGGILRRPVMISEGIWFSYEAAEDHLKAKAHRYPKTAFVYCDSAHDSWAGLRKLMEMLKAAQESDPSHLALRNVRALAIKIKRAPDSLTTEEVADHLLRFTKEGGAEGSILRGDG